MPHFAQYLFFELSLLLEHAPLKKRLLLLLTLLGVMQALHFGQESFLLLESLAFKLGLFDETLLLKVL